MKIVRDFDDLAGIDSLSMIVEDMLDVLGYEIEEDAEVTKEVFDN